MRPLQAMTIATVLLGGLAACTGAGTPVPTWAPATPQPTAVNLSLGSATAPAIPYAVFGSDAFQVFLRNDAYKVMWTGELGGRTLQLGRIRSLDDWDGVFGPAAVMGANKPFAPDATLFENREILVVAHVVPSVPHQNTFQITSATAQDGVLVVGYTFGVSAAHNDATFGDVRGIVIPRGDYSRIRFVENGEYAASICLAEPQLQCKAP